MRAVATGLALLAFCLTSCGGDGRSNPVRGKGTQYVVTDGDFVRFYLGADVRSELSETGAFVPRPGKAYQRVDLPTRLIPSRSDTTSVYSLCDKGTSITLFNSVPAPFENLGEWAPRPETLVDPYLRLDKHGVTETYSSGDQGVFGHVAVTRRGDQLSVGVVCELMVPVGEGYRGGALYLGELGFRVPPQEAGERCELPGSAQQSR